MNSKRLCLFVLVAVAALAASHGRREAAALASDTLPGVAGSWTAERAFAPRTITSFLGAPRALALDSGGNPHAVYGGDRLYHAYRDGGGWHYEVADARQGVSDTVALALDAADRAHVVYRDAANRALRYATNASGAWTTELVAPNVSVTAIAIALDPSNRPRVAYQDDVADETRHAVSAAGAWTSTRLDIGGVGCGLAIDAGGRSHVSYQRGFRGGVKRTMRYATDASGRWRSETVDESGTSDGSGNGIALDAAGKVHVLYGHQEASAGFLRHASNASGAWVRDTITTPSLNATAGASIAIDAADTVHVSAGAGVRLVYATNASGSFVVEDVAAGSGVTSIVARAGGVAVLHRNASVLHLTEGASHAWTTSIVDTSSTPGAGLSLALDPAGKAYVTHVNSTGDGGTPHLDLAFTTNASGTWTTETVDSGYFGISPTSIVVDGAAHAHVAYSNGSRALRYATNASGAWVAETADASLSQGPALAFDSQSRPRIAFGAGGQVRYAKKDGAVWSTEVIDAGTSGSLRRGLAIDGADHAHVVYGDLANRTIVHATNASGAWVRTVIGSISAVPVGVGYGEPAIAVDGANRSHVVWLKRGPRGGELAYATDVSGAWTESTMAVGAYGSLPSITLDAAGNVHVADSCAGRLCHVTNASGAWRAAVIDTGAAGEREFTADVFAADEDAGTAVVSVAPSGSGFVATYSGIRIAPDGRPRFAYDDGLMGDVKFARPDDGGGVPAVTVDVTTASGTAAAGPDFVVANATLAWTVDDGGTKTFVVQLAPDGLLEGSETISLALGNPTGGLTLGPRATATLVVRDGDVPAAAVGSHFLPRAVAVKIAGTKSRLTASGFFDTGATQSFFSGPAVLTIGGLAVAIPSTAKTVKGVFRYSADGIDFSLTPSKFGSSRGVFKLEVSGRDLAGLVDPAAPLTLRYDDVAVDGAGEVGLTNGRYKLGAVRGALLAPSVFLKKVVASVTDTGEADASFTLIAGLGGLGDAPDAAPEVQVKLGAFGGTVPGASFKKAGEKFTFKGGKTGVTSMVLDYDREELAVAVKAVDLGGFAQGAQPVLVTIRVGAVTRTAVVRMVRSGGSMRY